MPEDADAVESSNYLTFRDCLSTVVIKQLSSPPETPGKRKQRKSQHRPGRKTSISKSTGPSSTVTEVNDDDNDVKDNDGPSNHPPPTSSDTPSAKDAEDLSDFIEYLAADIFPSLPVDLRTLSYTAVRNSSTLAAKYEPPVPTSTLEAIAACLPPSTLDSLTSYGILPSTSTTSPETLLLPFLLKPLLTAYTTTTTTPPPSLPTPTARTPPPACELCARDWVPLTYHHLIPRSVHAKAVKRGWHEAWRLQSVAWLCRACHSFVHGVAGNEELAREWWSVELLMGREDVRAWVGWVGRVRWKAR